MNLGLGRGACGRLEGRGLEDEDDEERSNLRIDDDFDLDSWERMGCCKYVNYRFLILYNLSQS